MAQPPILSLEGIALQQGGKRLFGGPDHEPLDLHVGPRERFWRQVFSTACMFLIACIGTALITFVMYINGAGIYREQALIHGAGAT